MFSMPVAAGFGLAMKPSAAPRSCSVLHCAASASGSAEPSRWLSMAKSAASSLESARPAGVGAGAMMPRAGPGGAQPRTRTQARAQPSPRARVCRARSFSTARKLRETFRAFTCACTPATRAVRTGMSAQTLSRPAVASARSDMASMLGWPESSSRTPNCRRSCVSSPSAARPPASISSTTPTCTCPSSDARSGAATSTSTSSSASASGAGGGAGASPSAAGGAGAAGSARAARPRISRSRPPTALLSRKLTVLHLCPSAQLERAATPSSSGSSGATGGGLRVSRGMLRTKLGASTMATRASQHCFTAWSTSLRRKSSAPTPNASKLPRAAGSAWPLAVGMSKPAP
mmetsp:Transcript_25620/g.80202  ORF Transcript_25620/g.80202 Transcript_25620/m.80202 type:complete len:346 (-) Transcript_25620:512-1549(-)